MQINYKKINEIIPYEKNPRKISKGVDTVADSIERYGFQQPIVVDKDYTIVVGHTRFQAAKKLGLKEVPVVVAEDLDDDQIRAYRIMDNKSGEKSLWDDDLLIEELGAMLADNDIHTVSGDTGFTEAELDKWFNTVEDSENPLAANNAPAPRAQVGDIWTLGDHRIACGDSTDTALMATLMGDERIELIWEDPPYGISYSTANNVNKTKEEAAAWDAENTIKNDSLTPEELDILLNQHISLAKAYWAPGGSIYWCHDIRFTQQFKDILAAYKVHVSDTLIWKKNNASNWMSNYAKYYEPILYGWENSAPHRWYGHGMNPNTNQPTDLEDLTKEQLIQLLQDPHSNYQEFAKIPAKTASKWHPTVKPPKLIAYHIVNSTKPNDIVYDGFSGSGSTLIAAEKTGRRARCIEFQPKYVDITITRWQEETGLKAVNQDGTLWDEVVNTALLDDDIMDNLSTTLNLEDYNG